MDAEMEPGTLSGGLTALLVILPVAGGGLLFLLFERGPVHDLGLFLIGTGVLVGGVLLLMRMELG